MIEIYTDGSHKTDTSKKVAPHVNCSGVGIVLRVIDPCYNEVVKEEYRAIRYSQIDLMEKIENDEGFFECFDSLTSTLIECVGFVEGVKLFKHYYDRNKYETATFFIDDVFMSKTFNRYKEAILNGENIKEHEFYGCYMCMMHKVLEGDVDLINSITVEHVDGHKDNIFNNTADYLASYYTNPQEKMIKMFAKTTPINEIANKRTYHTFLQNLLKSNLEI